MKALEREVREIRQANEILRKASAYLAQAEFDRRFKPWRGSWPITATRTESSRSAGCCRSLDLLQPCGAAGRSARAPGRSGGSVLEQTLHARQRERELIHNSDRDARYAGIRYSERLAEAGINPSVGSMGDSYDNALADTINGR